MLILLEDVIVGWLHADPLRIPNIRESQDSLFKLEFFESHINSKIFYQFRLLEGEKGLRLGFKWSPMCRGCANPRFGTCQQCAPLFWSIILNIVCLCLHTSKLDYNWRFLVELFATFAPLGVPSLAKFKALLMDKLTNTPPLQKSFFFPQIVPALWGSLLYLRNAIWIVSTEDFEEVCQGHLVDAWSCADAL